MTHISTLHRRALLLGVGGVSLAFVGCARAQGAPGGRRKLVVIVARGAMDGLSVTVPYQDRNYATLRGDLALKAPGETGGVLPLSDGFGLHPALKTVHDLYRADQMRFAPAVAIPVRVRSHFDAQDILENGGEALRAQNDGWLNRALSAAGAGHKGLSIGAQTPLILRGAADTSSWAPGGEVKGEDRIASLLQDLYVDDPLLRTNLARGLATDAMAMAAGDDEAPVGRRDLSGLGQAVGRLMKGADGADVVALSADGWDTHVGQVAQLQRRLEGLDQLVSGLKTALGPDWDSTAVVVATEFGRTARANGTHGTDHGTASTLMVMGGAVKRGGLIGDWPTLAQNRLFEDRDLAPTLDVRSVFKGLLRHQLGVDRAALDARVFPDSAAEAPVLDGLIRV